MDEKLADYQQILIEISNKKSICYHENSGDCYFDAVELLEVANLAERVLLKHGIIRGRDY